VGVAPGLRSQSYFGGVGSSHDHRGSRPLPRAAGATICRSHMKKGSTSSDATDQFGAKHQITFKERAPSSQQNCTEFRNLARPQAAAFEL
jgi:hypothetical protein